MRRTAVVVGAVGAVGAVRAVRAEAGGGGALTGLAAVGGAAANTPTAGGATALKLNRNCAGGNDKAGAARIFGGEISATAPPLPAGGVRSAVVTGGSGEVDNKGGGDRTTLTGAKGGVVASPCCVSMASRNDVDTAAVAIAVGAWAPTPLAPPSLAPTRGEAAAPTVRTAAGGSLLGVTRAMASCNLLNGPSMAAATAPTALTAVGPDTDAAAVDDDAALVLDGGVKRGGASNKGRNGAAKFFPAAKFSAAAFCGSTTAGFSTARRSSSNCRRHCCPAVSYLQTHWGK